MLFTDANLHALHAEVAIQYNDNFYRNVEMAGHTFGWQVLKIIFDIIYS
jgi:hypothetical protein